MQATTRAYFAARIEAAKEDDEPAQREQARLARAERLDRMMAAECGKDWRDWQKEI